MTFPIRPETGLPTSDTGADVLDVVDALNSTLGRRFAVDDETVAAGLFAVAGAIDRLADTVAAAMKVSPQKPRRG